MIKLLPTSPEDYEKGSTTHMGNFKEWGTLMRKYRQESGFDIYQDILGDNRESFKAILGERGCVDRVPSMGCLENRSHSQNKPVCIKQRAGILLRIGW